MNLFNRRTGAEPVPAAASPPPLSELELAERKVQAADANLSRLRREFLDLQERYRLLVDTNGNIIQPLVADDTTRDEISRKLHEHRIARGIALRQFHAALGEWAKVKSTP
jgi:hypothetical protein